jgi:hypothetical protein
MHRLPIILFILATLLQIADATTTYLILSKGGKELWKPMAWVFSKIGILPGLIVMKLILVGFMTALLLYGGIFTMPLLTIICVAYIGVVVFNLRSVK